MQKLTKLIGLDWDVKQPGTINQRGTAPLIKEGQTNIYDGRPLSWASDIHGGPEPSTLVRSIDYNGQNLTLKITYKDGFTAIYDDISADMAKALLESDSKGRWCRENLWNRRYR